jgi:DNA-binding NarL/FixJ family response regulator
VWCAGAVRGQQESRREWGLGAFVATVFAVHANASHHLTVSRAVAGLPRTDLVGRSASMIEALRVFDTLAPDAVTLDVRLPDGDGIALARQLRERRHDLCVVAFGSPTHRLLRRAVAAGVAAYVPYTADSEQAAAAIQACLSGGGSFTSRTLSEALRHGGSSGLSRREREVDDLSRAGLSTVEIATRLGVGETTVRTYVARVRAKLGGEPDLPSAG